MHAGVLHLERNPRVPITLSHSQAREPIYSSSVGRWHHDDWLFGDEWEQVAVPPGRRATGGSVRAAAGEPGRG